MTSSRSWTIIKLFKKLNRIWGVIEVEYDYRCLSGKIVEKFGTQAAFSKEMGLSERSVSLKINNKVPFTQREITRAMELLCIPRRDVCRYFFAPKVQKHEL